MGTVARVMVFSEQDLRLFLEVIPAQDLLDVLSDLPAGLPLLADVLKSKKDRHRSLHGLAAVRDDGPVGNLEVHIVAVHVGREELSLPQDRRQGILRDAPIARENAQSVCGLPGGENTQGNDTAGVILS